MGRGRVFIPLVFNFKMSKNKGLDTNRNKWIQYELKSRNSYSAGHLHTSLDDDYLHDEQQRSSSVILGELSLACFHRLQ